MLTVERAKLRATDENVPQALSGYRPQVAAGLSAGLLAVRNLMVGGDSQSAPQKPWQAGLTVNQILFNGKSIFGSSLVCSKADCALAKLIGRCGSRAVIANCSTLGRPVPGSDIDTLLSVGILDLQIAGRVPSEVDDRSERSPAVVRVAASPRRQGNGAFAATSDDRAPAIAHRDNIPLYAGRSVTLTSSGCAV